MPRDIEIYPKSSPFESFLATAIHDIWRVQNQPRIYIKMIRRFVQTFIPTFFEKKIKFDFKKEIEETEREIMKIEKRIVNADPYDQSAARSGPELAEEVELAERMFKAALDALFEQKLLIPMRTREGREMR